jgi:hypothetical protein
LGVDPSVQPYALSGYKIVATAQNIVENSNTTTVESESSRGEWIESVNVRRH